MKSLYNRVPPRLQRVLVTCYRLYNELRPEFWIADGHLGEGDVPVSVLCVAPSWDRPFLFGQVLGAPYEERCIGRAWLWNLSKVAAGPGKDCCVAIVRTWPRYQDLLGPRKWLKLPCWVEGEVDIPLAHDVLKSKNVKKDLRKIRKNGFTYEVTRDDRAFEDFYHNMHVPYITWAHGDSASIKPYSVLHERFAAGELLLVIRDTTHVAGALISYSQAGPTHVALGVRDANWEVVREGAISGAYHFMFRHLVDKGFIKVGLGKSRAFLHDGVLAYKRKLGMRIVGASNGHFCVSVLKATQTAGAFLLANPLIFEQEGSFYGAVFVEADVLASDEEAMRRLCHDFFIEGLSQLLLVPLDAPIHAVTLPHDVAGRVAIRSASEIIGCEPRPPEAVWMNPPGPPPVAQ